MKRKQGRKAPRRRARAKGKRSNRARKITTKVTTVSVRKTNPVIMARSRDIKNPVELWYDGGKRFVPKVGHAATYPTKEHAKGVALELIRKYPTLRHWDVYVREGK